MRRRTPGPPTLRGQVLYSQTQAATQMSRLCARDRGSFHPIAESRSARSAFQLIDAEVSLLSRLRSETARPDLAGMVGLAGAGRDR